LLRAARSCFPVVRRISVGLLFDLDRLESASPSRRQTELPRHDRAPLLLVVLKSSPWQPLPPAVRALDTSAPRRAGRVHANEPARPPPTFSSSTRFFLLPRSASKAAPKGRRPHLRQEPPLSLLVPLPLPLPRALGSIPTRPIGPAFWTPAYLCRTEATPVN
jgi:hypothetical protein